MSALGFRTDDKTIKFTFPSATAVAINDLLFNNSGVAAKASAQADQGTELGNQELFASLFLGLSGDQRLAGETGTATRTVLTDVVVKMTCPSTTWAVGDLVGPSENSGGDGLENQQIEKVTVATAAIGYCVEGGTSLTSVWVRLISRYTPGIVYRGNLDASLADDVPLILGDGSDARVLWSTGDASNHALVLALGASQALHVTDVAALATDWNVSADTHPTIYVHSDTTPATDYMTFGAHDGTIGHINVAGGTTLSLDIGGTAAALLTAEGLTLSQGANDTLIFAGRSSDVTTGLTTIVKGGTVTTNDFFSIAKAAATTGGVYLQGLAESTATESMFVESWGGAPATTDTSGSLGAMNFFVGQHNGSNADADMAADSNAFTWGEIDSNNARLTRMLLKADDGELHLGNATPAALDHEDDVMLVRAMQKESSGGTGIVETIYDRPNPFTDYNRLRELKLVGEKDASGFHLFPLQPRLALHEGAIWQSHLDVLALASVLPAEARAQLPERLRERLGELNA